MTTTLNTTCYNVEDGEIVEGKLSDFDNLIECTTRPTGVGYKYYATTVRARNESDTDDDGNEVMPTEEFRDQWVLAKWATWGGPQVVVREFDTEEEAEAAAEETYVHDILNHSDTYVYLDRAQAEQALASQQANAE